MKKAQAKKLDAAEMRMLRWMSGVTKLDRIANERIRGTTKVGEISKSVQESRLKWYRQVLRREEKHVGKIMMVMEVPGKRRRGRPNRRWLDYNKNDRLVGERIVRARSARPSSMYHKKHRLHITLGKDAEEEDCWEITIFGEYSA